MHGNHTAILVATCHGLRIVNQWPPPGGPRVPWCSAEVTVPGIAGPLHLYSVHFSARSLGEQLRAAELVASYASQQAPALVGGDFNGYPRAGPVPAASQLRALRPHQQLVRACRGPDGTLSPSYDVDDLLTGAGLTDMAGALPAARRDPAGLSGTAEDGTARLDRCYATPDLAAAAVSCRQLPIGSDHDAVAFTFDTSILGGQAP
jgi:endonuclease/exonuclease/phosphatase family metal-dependent hydrolase